jgi:hypothetical protein
MVETIEAPSKMSTSPQKVKQMRKSCLPFSKYRLTSPQATTVDNHIRGNITAYGPFSTSRRKKSH